MTSHTLSLTDAEFNDRLLDSIDELESVKWFVRARASQNAFMADRCCMACGKALKGDNNTTLHLIDGTIELGPKCSRLLKKMSVI